MTGVLLALTLSVRAQSTQPRTAKRQPQANAALSPQAAGIVKRADQAREAGQLDEALELYQKALQLQPKWSEGWWDVGTILYERDRYAEARDAFRNLVALSPKRAPAWGMLGLCEFQTRD